LIEGSGLNFFIETNSPMLKGKRVEFLVQLADGLEYIHQQKYMHRDICPRNTMINQEGAVKIIDFGLTIPYTKDFCKPGNRTGTPSYLAPELIKRTTTDHRVDLFALGVTAYETFTGRLPWEKAPSMETLLSHMNRAGKHPREFRPDLDEKLVALLIKAIQRDPNERFQTAAAFREALKALPKQDY
jgi:eukaryotic-like serine/threonine-protein kinase